MVVPAIGTPSALTLGEVAADFLASVVGDVFFGGERAVFVLGEGAHDTRVFIHELAQRGHVLLPRESGRLGKPEAGLGSVVVGRQSFQQIVELVFFGYIVPMQASSAD